MELKCSKCGGLVIRKRDYLQCEKCGVKKYFKTQKVINMSKRPKDEIVLFGTED